MFALADHDPGTPVNACGFDKPVLVVGCESFRYNVSFRHGAISAQHPSPSAKRISPGADWLLPRRRKKGGRAERAQVLLAPSSSSLSLGFCPETAALPYAFRGDGNNASMTLARLDREHLHRWLKAAVLGAALCSAASSAEAEPQPHTMPVLRTPPRSQSPLGAAAGAPPLPKPWGAADAKDPMTGLKIRPNDIAFKPVVGSTLVNFDLDDADLPDLVKAITNITGKRFIYGSRLRRVKATVYAPEKVTAAEAYRAFLSILQTNGMTVLQAGRFLKIVETPGVVQQDTPVYGLASPLPSDDRYVTRLYRLAHVDTNDVLAVLGKFRSRDGDLTAFLPGRLIIMTDTATNINRMLRILEEVDVGGAGDQLWVEPVHYALASDLANKLSDVLELNGKGGQGRAPAGRGGRQTRVVGDDRDNRLVIIGNEPDYLRILALVQRLDVKRSGEGEVHILPLQHAACKDLSQTLNTLVANSSVAGARPSGGTPGALGTSVDQVFEGRLRMTCDEATNSLVTTSSLRDYARLRTVIEKLDHPRRQVFIEAVIMDVNIDRETDWGVAYHGGAPLSVANGQGLFWGGNNPAVSMSSVPQNLEALAIGLRGPDIPNSSNLLGTGISIPALGVVLDALAKDGDTNIMATPHLLATDNIKAQISIGQNIPLQTNVGGGLSALASQATGATGAIGGLGGLGLLGGGFQAPRQDVGTKVTVVPHVNDSEQVRLELTEEISEQGSPLGALGAIPITKRTATTTLVVRDQQTVVIGGLVRDLVSTSETKIPILGDIPVLGFLFKQSTKKKTKQNLLLILTPYVIRDQDDLRAIFERKMQERQEFIDRYLVFDGRSAWVPPRDYRRANGLLEEIRQAVIAQDERERLREGGRRRAPKEHVARPPASALRSAAESQN